MRQQRGSLSVIELWRNAFVLEILSLPSNVCVAPIRKCSKLTEFTCVFAFGVVQSCWRPAVQPRPPTPHGQRTLLYDVGAEFVSKKSIRIEEFDTIIVIIQYEKRL